MWVSSHAWESGWGDVGAPHEPPASIRNGDAEVIDYGIMRLSFVHRSIIKRHYIDHDGQRREQLDEACRALEDLMR
jgi:hypothetical protein